MTLDELKSKIAGMPEQDIKDLLYHSLVNITYNTGENLDDSIQYVKDNAKDNEAAMREVEEEEEREKEEADQDNG